AMGAGGTGEHGRLEIPVCSPGRRTRRAPAVACLASRVGEPGDRISALSPDRTAEVDGTCFFRLNPSVRPEPIGIYAKRRPAANSINVPLLARPERDVVPAFGTASAGQAGRKANRRRQRLPKQRHDDLTAQPDIFEV